MKKLKLFIFVLFILVFSFPVFSQNYSKQDGLDWLKSNINFGQNVQESSLAVLAFRNNDDLTTAQIGINSILSIIDPNNCFPTGACTVKDTAFALVALNVLNKQEATNVAGWLKDSQIAAENDQGWFIQIVTSAEGTCEISYNNKSEDVEIFDNEDTSCGTPWISVGPNQCVDTKLGAETEFTVDCSSLQDFNTKISLVYRTGNSIEIIEQQDSSFATLTVRNNCWGKRMGSNLCDLESTAYAVWALNRIGDPIPSNYLNLNANTPLFQAIAALSDDSLIEVVESSQNKAGYWGDMNVYETSLILETLKSDLSNSSKAISWLESRQIKAGIDKGSWNGNLLHTSSALFALGSAPVVTGVSGGVGNTYCGDNLIQQPNSEGFFEECDNLDDDLCPGQCSVDCTCSKTTQTCQSNDDCSVSTPVCDTSTGRCVECLTNSDCDLGEVCSNNLCIDETTTGIEAYCGDGFCDSNEDSKSCPNDCGERKGNIFFIILIIFLVFLVVLFIYLRFFRKKPKKGKGGGPSKPYYLKTTPKTPPLTTSGGPTAPVLRKRFSKRDEQLEKELEESIKEAQKLLKKKR